MFSQSTQPYSTQFYNVPSYITDYSTNPPNYIHLQASTPLHNASYYNNTNATPNTQVSTAQAQSTVNNFEYTAKFNNNVTNPSELYRYFNFIFII